MGWFSLSFQTRDVRKATRIMDIENTCTVEIILAAKLLEINIKFFLLLASSRLNSMK